MRAEIVARNYAQTLLELAGRHGGRATVEEYGRAMELLGDTLADRRVREFLSTPRVGADERKQALRAALEGRVPELFLRFVMVVVDKRRQALLPDIAAEYRDLTDELAGRVRVQVTVSHAPDDALRDEITRTLTARLGKTVIPTFTVNPEILGGIVVRVGDDILDGSIRTRAAHLKRRLMAVALPREAA